MSVDRVASILRHASSGDVTMTPAEHLCVSCTSVLAVSGAGLALTTDDGTRRTICATDQVSDRIEDLQVMLGEGPCVDARASGSPVMISDLRGDPTAARWPAFTPSSLEAGVRAVFALPLRVGAIDVGTLDLYRDSPGDLDDESLALAFADAALRLMLDDERTGHSETATKPQHIWETQSQVHQASGMVMVQMDTDIGAAFAVLRAHAYRFDRQLGDVAADVVSGRLRFK